MKLCHGGSVFLKRVGENVCVLYQCQHGGVAYANKRTLLSNISISYRKLVDQENKRAKEASTDL